ncbi:MAG: FMN-binding protein, partial [Blautia sp.]|nr:FMN-binding protein [Blautia sp.]
LAKALVENQSLDVFTMDAQGKTDAVSGVSISIGGFVNLAKQCMYEAAGIENEESLTLADGEYTAKGEPDDSGFTDQVTMTVADGKITEVSWDALGEDGTSKSVLSEKGEYTMTEDGPTWKEQAESLAKALVENQSLDVFTMDAQGKTDAVSGVSISIGGFVSLAQDCLNQAAGVEAEPTEAPVEAPAEEAPENGTVVDGVSGATISSTAAVNAINMAFDFLNAAK